MTSPNDLPETMKALVLESTDKPPTIETVPIPQPTLGSAIVRVLAANTISYIVSSAAIIPSAETPLWYCTRH